MLRDFSDRIPDPPREPIDWGRIISALALVAAVVLFAASLPGFGE